MQTLISFFRNKTDAEKPLLEKPLPPPKKSSGYEEIQETTVKKTKDVSYEFLLKKTAS